MKDITGFENYTQEVIYSLRGLFADGKIESRPVRYINVVMWVDGNMKLHRENNLPAIEREDGTREYWIRGVRKNNE